MVRRLVEGREVVVVELHLRPLGNPVAESEEDVDDLTPYLLDEMPTADRMRATRQGHVDGIGGDARLKRGCGEHGVALLNRRLKRDADLVRHLACRGTLLGRERTEPAQDARERPLLAEIRHTHRVERGEIDRAAIAREPLVTQCSRVRR